MSEDPRNGEMAFDLLLESLRLVRERWAVFLALAVTVYLPVIALDGYLTLQADAHEGELAAMQPIIEGCFQALVVGALALMAFRFLEGAQASFGRSLGVVARKSAAERVVTVVATVFSLVFLSVAPTVAYHRLRRLEEGAETEIRPSPIGPEDDPGLAGKASP